jgi:hypothetical protein
MKIVKPGNVKGKHQRFECGKCGCVFEASENEFTTGDDRGEFYYRCKCPHCTNAVYKSGDIPASLTRIDYTK